MKKILLGLVAVLVIAVGGFFGFQFYVQQRIAGEIDTAFDQIRSAGGKAGHGKVSFDPLKHTVTIAEIEVQSASQPSAHVKIANITASGVSQPDPAHFAADTIEVAGTEVDAAMGAPAEWHLAYKVPRLTLKDFSGPAALPQRPASSSALDLYRFALEQFAGISASSMSLPDLAGTLDLNATAKIAADFSYSDLRTEGIKDGKIAVMKLGSVAYNMNTQQAGKTDKLSGKVEKLASYDIDLRAMAAILDPQNAGDDRYHSVYRQATAGAYAITTGKNQHILIDGLTIDDVALRPSRLQIPAMLAMLATTQKGPPTPEQARDLIEKVAGLYEGIHVGNYELRGMSMDTPQGPFKMAAMRFSLDAGRGDLVLEGLDATTPNGPFKVGRFALKSLDVAHLMRFSALFANPAQRPPPQQAVQLLGVLEGAEVKGVVAPFKDGKKTVRIDTINLNWGQFVGSIPTKAHLDARLASPVDPTNPAMLPLAIAGIDTMALDANLSAAWDETSGGFVLDAPTFELGSLLKASARVALAKVPRGAFTLDPQQATTAAAEIEAGALELTLRDLGAVDLFVAQYARMHSMSRDAARSAIVDAIRTGSEKAVAANPDTQAAVDTLIRFVETPRQTLVVRLTPLGHVPVMQLGQLLNTDPLLVLAQFRIEVSTGL
jgi:hypothetical protein